jgi:hypothetical protein
VYVDLQQFCFRQNPRFSTLMAISERTPWKIAENRTLKRGSSPPEQRYGTFKSLHLKHLCSATLKQIQNLVPHRLMSRLKIQVHSRRHSCDVTSSSIWRPSLQPEKLAQDPIARFSSASLQTAFQTRSRAHYEVFLILVLHHPDSQLITDARHSGEGRGEPESGAKEHRLSCQRRSGSA